ncbi:hypothetical protein BESB_035180 [Besnoitia besnoiti]|uniref:Uncharacterized protein n=1 Tax=Besnoitia besnoiti TaxID=94643 RepID=A0A2A9MN41_BESBE|nr:hypothetical protein BESB_035180 [Besnoitia besnoiti]PFH37060.1 hypothetical protein BESB_035180 [Besnoitia besnoiti]
MEAGEVLVLAHTDFIPCSASFASDMLFSASARARPARILDPRSVSEKTPCESRGTTCTGAPHSVPSVQGDAADAPRLTCATTSPASSSSFSSEGMSASGAASKRAPAGRGRPRGGGGDEEETVSLDASGGAAGRGGSARRRDGEKEAEPRGGRAGLREEEAEKRTSKNSAAVGKSQRSHETLRSSPQGHGTVLDSKKRKDRKAGGEAGVEASSAAAGESSPRASGNTGAAVRRTSPSSLSRTITTRGTPSAASLITEGDARVRSSSVVDLSACASQADAAAASQGAAAKGETRGRPKKGKKDVPAKRCAGPDREEKKGAGGGAEKGQGGDALAAEASTASSPSPAPVAASSRKEKKKEEEENKIPAHEASQSEPREGVEQVKGDGDAGEKRGKEKQNKPKKKAKKEAAPVTTGRARKGDKPKPDEKEKGEPAARDKAVCVPGDEREREKERKLKEKKSAQAASSATLEGEPQAEKKKKKKDLSGLPASAAAQSKSKASGADKPPATSRETKVRTSEAKVCAARSVSSSLHSTGASLPPSRSSCSLPASSSSNSLAAARHEESALACNLAVSPCVPSRRSEPHATVSLPSALGSIRFGGMPSALSVSTCFLLQTLLQRREAARNLRVLERGSAFSASCACADAEKARSKNGVLASPDEAQTTAVGPVVGDPARADAGPTDADAQRSAGPPEGRDAKAAVAAEAQSHTGAAGGALETKADLQREKGSKTLVFSRKDGTLESFFSLLGSASSTSTPPPVTRAASSSSTACLSSSSSFSSSSLSSTSASPPSRQQPQEDQGGGLRARAKAAANDAAVSPTSLLVGLLTRPSARRGAGTRPGGEEPGDARLQGRGAEGETESAAGPLLSLLLSSPHSRGGPRAEPAEPRACGVDGQERADFSLLPARLDRTPSADAAAGALAGSSSARALLHHAARPMPAGAAPDLKEPSARLQPALAPPAVPPPNASSLRSHHTIAGLQVPPPATLGLPLGRTKSAPAPAAHAAVAPLVPTPASAYPAAGSLLPRLVLVEAGGDSRAEVLDRLLRAKAVASPSSSSRSSSVFVLGERERCERRLGAGAAKAGGKPEARNASKEKRRRAGVRRSTSVEAVGEAQARERLSKKKEGKAEKPVPRDVLATKAGAREFAAPSFMAIPFPHEVPPPPFLRM